MDRLYRSRTDRMLAGVAGGLAEMWGADPSLVRIIWAVLVVMTGGLALLVYIVMAIVVPEGDPMPWPPAGAPGMADGPLVDPLADPSAAGSEPPAAGTGWTAPGSGWTAAPPRAVHPRPRGQGSSSVPLLLGGFLVILGAFFLVREFLPQIDFDWFWPAMLVLLGVVILVNAMGRDRGPGGRS